MRRVLTNSDPRCEVVIMMRPDGGASAAIMSNNLPVTRHEIEPPREGERLVVKRTNGCVDVYYEDDDNELAG